jgi:hypothetical protein
MTRHQRLLFPDEEEEEATNPYLNPQLPLPEVPVLKERILKDRVLQAYYRPDLFLFSTPLEPRPGRDDAIAALRKCTRSLSAQAVWRLANSLGVFHLSKEPDDLRHEVALVLFSQVTEEDAPTLKPGLPPLPPCTWYDYLMERREGRRLPLFKTVVRPGGP